MEKILNIDGRQVKFKSTGAFLLRYKMQFNRDALQDITVLQKRFGKKVDITKLTTEDLESLYNISWALARNASPDIPEPMEWLDTFDEFPILDVAPELIYMALLSLSSAVKLSDEAKKIRVDDEGEEPELSTEAIMHLAIQRGLALVDFEHLTVGMIIDYATTCTNMEYGGSDSDKTKTATQADFDNF